jgi:hypothetical protein
VDEELSAWGIQEARAAIRGERERRNLDATNWDSEPFITHRQLNQMSSWRAHSITCDPKWVDDPYRMVLINTKHPNNEEWVQRLEAKTHILRALES